ncbi:hypothetical protein D3C86_969290 [compost metagenome]
MAQGPVERASVGPAHGGEEGVLLLAQGPLEPERGEDRHQGQGEDERAEHREGDGEGHGAEHLALHPLEGEEGQEHHDDDRDGEDHRTAHLDGRAVDGLDQGLLAVLLAQVAEDVLDHDDGRVDHHAEADGEAPQAHEVAGQVEQLHHREGEEHRERNRHGDDQAGAQVPEEEEQNPHHQHAAFEQGLLDGVDRLLHQLELVVEGLELHAGRHDRVGLGELLLDAADHLARVLALELHDDADDGLVAIAGGGPLARSGALDDLGHVAQVDGVPLAGGHHGPLELLGPLHQAQPADQVLLVTVLEVVAGGVGVVARHRAHDVVEGQAVGRKAIRPDLDLVLLEQAAQAVDLGHPGHPAQEGPDDPVLDRAALGQREGAFDRVLEDLAHAGGDRAHGGPHPFGHLALDVAEALGDELAREVDVHPVVEDDGDDREAELGGRANLVHLGQAVHLDLDGVSHQALDLGGGEPLGLGQDLDLDVGHIREGVDGQALEREEPHPDQHEAQDQGQEALAQREADEAIDHC